jgi:hypothetical protein
MHATSWPCLKANLQKSEVEINAFFKGKRFFLKNTHLIYLAVEMTKSYVFPLIDQ